MLDRLGLGRVQRDLLRINPPPLRAERLDPKASRLEPPGQGFGTKPAFAIRWPTNMRGSGRCRQTLGRNRARRLPAERISPSRSGSRAPTSSDSLPARIGRGWERIEMSRRSPLSSDSFNGAKRGSAKAARVVLASASSISDRRGMSEPMQPRSCPFSVRVTKVARQGENGCCSPSRLIGGAAPPVCVATRRAVMQAESRRSRSVSASRAEAAYSNAKAP